MRIHDSAFGALLLVGGLALFLYARGLPALPGQAYGPGLLPSLLAVGFALCGAVLAVSGLRARGQGRARLVELGDWTRGGGRVADVGLVVLGLALLMALWETVGFLIGGTLFAGGLIARFRGGRIVTSMAAALAASAFIDWSFRKLLLVPLPPGPLAGVIW